MLKFYNFFYHEIFEAMWKESIFYSQNESLIIDNLNFEMKFKELIRV